MLSEIAALARKLEDERAKLLTLLQSANAEQRERLIYDEGWHLPELVSHLASAEKENVRFLAEVVASHGARHLPDGYVFDLNQWNAGAVEARAHLSWDERMAELHETRQHTLALLAALDEEQLRHRGTHAVWGEKDVTALIRIVYLHDNMHRIDIARRLSA